MGQPWDTTAGWSNGAVHREVLLARRNGARRRPISRLSERGGDDRLPRRALPAAGRARARPLRVLVRARREARERARRHAVRARHRVPLVQRRRGTTNDERKDAQHETSPRRRRAAARGECVARRGEDALRRAVGRVFLDLAGGRHRCTGRRHDHGCSGNLRRRRDHRQERRDQRRRLGRHDDHRAADRSSRSSVRPRPTSSRVSIDGVTITGGVNNSQPDTAVTFGGGIWIPTSQLPDPPFNGTGATVVDHEQRHHRQHRPLDVAIPGDVFCGPLPCGFNSGGGIDNGGVLTLTNVRVDEQRRRFDGRVADPRERHVGRRHLQPIRSDAHDPQLGDQREPRDRNGSERASRIHRRHRLGRRLSIESSAITDNTAETLGEPRVASSRQTALAGGLSRQRLL